MPTRYLKPGIRDSEHIDACDSATETLYYRLVVTVDDFGRYDARPSMVKSACFPVKDSMTTQHVHDMLRCLDHHRLIALYEVGGKPYLQMLRWDNKPRAAESHFPAPDGQLHTPVDNSVQACAQVDPSKQARTLADKPRTDLPVTGTVTGTETGVAPAPPASRKRPASSSKAFKPDEVELPPWLERADWVRWCVERRRQGKPIGEEGARLQLIELSKLRREGHTPKSVIDHSIGGAFQGLYPKKATPGTPAPTPEKEWHETPEGICKRGAELGLKWDGNEWERNHDYPHWGAYKAKVLATDATTKKD